MIKWSSVLCAFALASGPAWAETLPVAEIEASKELTAEIQADLDEQGEVTTPASLLDSELGEGHGELPAEGPDQDEFFENEDAFDSDADEAEDADDSLVEAEEDISDESYVDTQAPEEASSADVASPPASAATDAAPAVPTPTTDPGATPATPVPPKPADAGDDEDLDDNEIGNRFEDGVDPDSEVDSTDPDSDIDTADPDDTGHPASSDEDEED